MDQTTYGRIHRWINKTYPKTGRCEWCGIINRCNHYASINHTYTYNRADWFELCPPCHAVLDGRAR